MFNQPAAKNGPNGGRDRCKARPCADRLAPTLLVERCADNRKAAGHEECGAHTLNASRDDQQLMNVRGEATTPRKKAAKNRNTNHEPPKRRPNRSPSEPPTRIRALQQESVRLNHPLHIHNRGAKAGLERRQSHIDDGAIDESHARTENGCCEDPWSRLRSTRNLQVALSFGLRLHRRAFSCRLWMPVRAHLVPKIGAAECGSPRVTFS